jgi:DNA-directed RNA polymerase delta subunit
VGGRVWGVRGWLKCEKCEDFNSNPNIGKKKKKKKKKPKSYSMAKLVSFHGCFNIHKSINAM